MRLLLALIPIALLTASAYEIHQSDWSGGPGVPGPNHYWYDTFKSETSITWDGSEGMIYLDMKSTQHLVGSGVGGTRFAYPTDINGDGNVDIVTSSTTNEKHAWFENDGTGNTWTEHIIDSSSPWPVYAAYPVDIDGDSYIDVVGGINTSSDDSLFWYRNTDGTGLVWEKHFIDLFPSPHCIYGADIDGDGDNDIIVGSYWHGVGISWWENLNGAGTYWQRHIVTEDEDLDNFEELCITDLDQDGDLDILSASSDFGSSDFSALCFWENVDGTGSEWSLYQFDTDPVYGVPYSVHAGDMDNDGDIDVLAVDAAPPDFGRVYWFENMDGSCEVWEQHIIDDEFGGACSVRAVDLTEDGHLDILAASGLDWENLQEIALWENIGGTATDWAKHPLDSGYTFFDLQTADVDKDGVLDIVSAIYFGAVFWYSLEGEDSGTLTSSIRDMWGNPEWESITWEGTEPAGTDMYFTLRSSNDPEDMGTWSEYIYEPGSLAGFIDSTHRYIQYAVLMETDGLFGTPVLDQVSFQFPSMGIEREDQTTVLLLSAITNPQMGIPSLSFVVSEPLCAELAVFDLAGRQVYSVSDSWSVGEQSVILPPLASGTYMVRLNSSEFTQTGRFVLLD